MLRNSFKYINDNDLKKFSTDFKAIYNAPTESAALSELDAVKERWGKKYPYAISNWENHWEDVSSFFNFQMISGALCIPQTSSKESTANIEKLQRLKVCFPAMLP